MNQEEMETEINMWKLRSNCVEHILSAQNKKLSATSCKRKGLEFNVGFGPKQKISVDSLTNKALLEIANFALAMNSSQQYFITEILEYNFDLCLQSPDHRNTSACEVMSRVRQLRSCEDAVKFSNEGVGHSGPLPSRNVTNLNVGSVVPEVSNISRMEKSDVATMCPPDSHAETEEHFSGKSADLYPLCKEIGLKLHVNSSQPQKKMDINKLTSGAMNEVTKFAEKLCGTFERICHDILSHNFDLDSQSGDSELVRNILARISTAIELQNLSSCTKVYKAVKCPKNNISTMEKLECQNDPSLDACSAVSSQKAAINQNIGSSAEIEHKNELDLKLWKLRANHIQHILSIPHVEHCPLYSYSRCKELGLDFNVGSGVKQNLDPKLLTNGIMVELNTFATAMASATKYFITEILEYNLDLNLKNELHRFGFALQTWNKVCPLIRSCKSHQINMHFELPDLSCIQEPSEYCPKCYQDRNHKLHPDESDAAHRDQSNPNTMTDTISTEGNYTAQKPSMCPSSTFSTTEETIMDGYPHCKKIGLKLCVDKDQPKDKLDVHMLTRGMMAEVANFAKKLCATKNEIIRALLEHNFSMDIQSQHIDLTLTFQEVTPFKDDGLAWFNEVFVLRPVPPRQPGFTSNQESASAKERSDLKEAFQKRKLALQTKKEKAKPPSQTVTIVKFMDKNLIKRQCYPICTEIGLDLDVKSKSEEKEKLDLNLLTKAVVYEIHKYASQKLRHFYPRTLFDILDYNFDLSSKFFNRWEFSIATASKVQIMAKEYCIKQEGADEVFILPFPFEPETSQRIVRKRQEKSAASSLDITSESESSCPDLHMPFHTCTDNSSRNVLSERDMDGEDMNQEDMDQEEMGSENYYTCPLGESDLSSDEVDNLGNTCDQDNLKNPESCSLSSDFACESKSNCLGIHTSFPISADFSLSLSTGNSKLNPPSEHHLRQTQLCGKEMQIPKAPTDTPNKFDMNQEEMETENNMWKLRSNCVEHILSAQNTAFSATSCRRIGLEFNVGFGPKRNISVDSLTNKALLEIANFALAMNSSQQYFITEILEYNFDLCLQSPDHRNTSACEVMSRVRQLRSCEDAVKFSNEGDGLPGPLPSRNVMNLNGGSVPEVSNISRMEKSDVATLCPPDSHAETEEHFSVKSADLYPLCKEIGLKLHVNSSQPQKKMDINKLTSGAMNEVTKFAEKLCGTFERICHDILSHNFDLDSQSGDSELVRNILARISTAIELQNLSSCTKVCKAVKCPKNNISTMEKLECQNDPSLDACSAVSSQTAAINQNIGSSAEIEHKNELDLKLWKLRANHIQHILSIPHVEHCPLYSYSRCKKLGLDFKVGSGVKQNLDPKLLTNGIMVELNTFATAMASATKYFITEILEYNFNLDLKNELHRRAFALQTWHKVGSMMKFCRSHLNNMPFQLPNLSYVQEPSEYCPKCYQDRNHKLHPNESDAAHRDQSNPNTMTDTISADGNYTAQKPSMRPSSAFSTTEETIMDGYPHCKKIGLKLCVDKDQPKDKLDMHMLTRGRMAEVFNFAKKLCPTKNEIIRALLEHNFSMDIQSQHIDLTLTFQEVTPFKDDGLAWFNEVFVLRPVFYKQPGYTSNQKSASAKERSDWKEAFQERKLALQTKKEKAKPPSQTVSVVKTRKKYQSKRQRYPFCTAIGLDLDVTSKSEEKEKLDLNLLTKAVVCEIHKYACKKLRHYYPQTVFDILNYNFDLSSQFFHRWEFSIATASKVRIMVKNYCRKKGLADEVFELPFVFDPETSQRIVGKRQKKSAKSSLDITSESESNCPNLHVPFHTCTDNSSSLPSGNSNKKSAFVSQADNRQTQKNRNVLCEWDVDREDVDQEDMDQEEMGSENYYTCPLGESDLSSDEVDNLGNTCEQDNLKNPESCSLSSDIACESKSNCLGIHTPFPISTDFCLSLSTGNSKLNPPSEHHLHKTQLCEKEMQIPKGPTDTPNKFDMNQEEMETENNMWKLRSDRVEHILSAQNTAFSATSCRRIGLEFNVGFGPKRNISAESLTNKALLEIANFALAMNSSQQYFITEILEYNFDLCLQSPDHRNTSACEVMSRVRQLRSCEDAVKFSNEGVGLSGPLPSRNVTNLNGGSVVPEVSNISRMEKSDVATLCPPDSHAETEEHFSGKSADLYPLCKEIGLKLHVNKSQPQKKMDINKLTSGAMNEVTKFAEKLCGTFEQICHDILSHNFDLDSQSGDSKLATNILARTSSAMDGRNLSNCTIVYRLSKDPGNNISTMEKLECQNDPSLDARSAVSSQKAAINQNIGSSAEIEHKNELDLKLWKLRANHIQHILSMPHVEHCPLYSYSRCKKLGLDFNVGSGVKQNLDPKLLTNGIMVELNTFATAMASATKYFITEILEYNLDLDLKNELHRFGFAQQTWNKAFPLIRSCKSHQINMPFKLPRTYTYIQEPSEYCPKCYQDRNHKLHPDESDAAHRDQSNPNTMTDTISTDGNYTAQKPSMCPSSAFSTTEETIMDGYPHCKKIGLKLCVDKDQPKDKLDVHMLTRGMMAEVVNFAKKLCATKSEIIRALLEHNFSMDIQSQHIDLTLTFQVTPFKDDWLAWFNEVFVIQRVPHRKSTYGSQQKRPSAMKRSDRKETVKKRKLALQTKEEKSTLPSHSLVKSRSKVQDKGLCYPICTKIGLDLDVTSTSGEREKLDLNLLTTAVVYEIHKFVTSKPGQYFPGTVFDILDYNFDLSSQHDRRWEFSIATASKIQSMVKRYRKNRDIAAEVFNLPFVVAPETSQKSVQKCQQKKSKKYPHEKTDKNRSQSTSMHQVNSLDVKHQYFLGGVQTNEEPWLYEGHTNSPIVPFTINEQMNRSHMFEGCGFQFPGNIQIQEEEEKYDPPYGCVIPERDTDGRYLSHYDFKTQSYNGDVKHLAPGGHAGSFGHTIINMCPQSQRNIKTESEMEGVQCYIVAESHGSEGCALLPFCPNSDTNTKMESDTTCVKYLIPVEAPPSQGCSMVTVDQCNERPLIKEEEEIIPVDPYLYTVVIQ